MSSLSYKTLEEVASQVSGCTRCSLHNYRLNAVPGITNRRDGEYGCEILFVDDFPTIEEDITGKPMVARNGAIFNAIMYNTFDLNESEVSIVHCVKCLPKYYSFRIEKTAKRESVFWCSEYLYTQIELLNPRLIISLGYLPFFVLLRNNTYTFLGKPKISMEPYVGNLYMAKSLLDSSKSWPCVPCYNIKAFVANRGKADKYLLEKIQGIYAKIRSGEDVSDLLRNSPPIQ